MPLKPVEILPDGCLRIKGSVTTEADETYADAIADALSDTIWDTLDKLAQLKCEPHHVNISLRWERDEPGRESSRRVFVIAIAEPRK
jgi:hypothetical protein